MADSTGLAKTFRLSVKGLQPGEYELRHGTARTRRSVKDVLVMEIPPAGAMNIIIGRIKA